MLNLPANVTNVSQEPGNWQLSPPDSRLGGTRRSIESTSLMQGSRELLIAHAGEEYRLRLTRNDKLILTK